MSRRTEDQMLRRFVGSGVTAAESCARPPTVFTPAPRQSGRPSRGPARPESIATCTRGVCVCVQGWAGARAWNSCISAIDTPAARQHPVHDCPGLSPGPAPAIAV